MFFEYYIISIACMVVCAIIGGWASSRVHSAFKAYDEMPTLSHATGYDTAKKLLRANGIKDVEVGKTQGRLTDHYHPKQGIVNLSEAVYGSDSIAACAVAAHEIGHVVQKKEGYLPYKLRGALVAVTNIGSGLAVPLVLVGVLLDVFITTTRNLGVGYYFALAGVVAYGLSTVFALATLPVEFNASRRAKKMLVQEGILTEGELPFAEKMLNAAAQTYVASLLTSLVFFLRFLLWVTLLFGRRRRN